MKWDEIDKLIRSLSHKVGKLELKNKSLSKQNAQGNNRGYNPQYRRPPLQILPRERKEQLNQIPHPLYLEDDSDEQSSDTHKMQGNLYSAFSEEEHENMPHQETNHDREATANEEDIDYYCKQFADFMQAQLHQRYDLRSSRKRSREPEQLEGTAPQDIPSILDKGKGNLNTESSKIKVSSNKENNSSKGHRKRGTFSTKN